MKNGTKEFLEHLHGLVEYWSKVADEKKLDYKSLADGVIFSTLVKLDDFLLIKTDDFGNVAECINDDLELHENWYN